MSMPRLVIVTLLVLAVLTCAASLAALPEAAAPVLAGLGIVAALAGMVATHRAMLPVRQLKDLARRVLSEPEQEAQVPTPPLGADLDAVAESLRELAHRIVSLGQEVRHLREASTIQSGRADQAEAEARDVKAERETLAAFVRDISAKTTAVSNGLNRNMRFLSTIVAHVGEGVEIQRFRLTDTASSMDRIAASVHEVADSVMTTSEEARISRGKALQGAGEIRDAVTDIEGVKDITLQLQQALIRLEERSANIGQVMSVINEVADQTNLLALNAAIEAARAGEAGRGFAVVADEVRKLAEKTMQATKEIGSVVEEIRDASRQNVAIVGEAAARIVQGTERAARAGQFMEEIAAEIAVSSGHLEKIVAAAAGQSEGCDLTNAALDEVSQVAGATAVRMQEFTAELVQIADNTEELELLSQALDRADGMPLPAMTRLVVWNRELDTGIRLIDSHHKMLCSYINALHRALVREQGQETMGEIVTALKEYAAMHFSTEEQYFSHTAYPHTEQHKQVHRDFVAKIEDVERRLLDGSTSVSQELLDFLKEWLIKHIQGTDQQYAPFVRAYEELAAGRTARDPGQQA